MKFWQSIRKTIFFRLSFMEQELERVRTERDVEIERLRAEVRLLMDTLLKANGLPTIHPVQRDPLPVSKGGRMLPSQFRRAVEAKSEETIGDKNKTQARAEA